MLKNFRRLNRATKNFLTVFFYINIAKVQRTRLFVHAVEVEALKMEEELSGVSCIRGYHVYKDIWDAAIGEVLVCEREPRNVEDRYAIAVKKDETVIGHLPRNLSRVCSHFIRRRGTIDCSVTGPPWIWQTVSRFEVLSYRYR